MMTNAVTLKVWIVDDEPGMCLGTERALKNVSIHIDDLGETVEFDVEMFSTGEDFLERIETGVIPDILLLDNKLPGIEGVEVLETLNKSGSKILVIMITAYATLEKAVRATKLGAYDFLAKPFTPNELKYSIRKATRNIILTRKAEELEAQKRQVRFEFISILAHELKSPLNAIDGYADLIKNKRAGDDLDTYIPMMERIEARLGGMRKLITDLLDMTSIESGKKQRNLADLNLIDVVVDIIDNNSELAERNEITVTCKTTEPVIFKSDRGEMEMLINNFVSNATKYNTPGGTAEVSIRSEASSVILTVADTGIGMSEDEQQKLFKEFSRIKNKKTKNIEGSGLGLSIINKILKLYNGSVDVHSVPDEGTTFTVTLNNP